jgi:hypothetical protein
MAKGSHRRGLRAEMRHRRHHPTTLNLHPTGFIVLECRSADLSLRGLRRKVWKIAVDGPETGDLVVAEYVALRNEVLKLGELQAQAVALAVVGFGTIVTVAAQTDRGELSFVYPLLSVVLGATWLNHAHGIDRFASYLRRMKAKSNGKFDWEHYVQRTPLRFGNFGAWAMRGIFPGTALAATGIGLAIVSYSA